MDGPQSLLQPSKTTPVGPFALMQARQLAATEKSVPKKSRGAPKGVKHKPEHLRLAEMGVELPVRFLLCLVAC